jgi:hypothetical protein
MSITDKKNNITSYQHNNDTSSLNKSNFSDNYLPYNINNKVINKSNNLDQNLFTPKNKLNVLSKNTDYQQQSTTNIMNIFANKIDNNNLVTPLCINWRKNNEQEGEEDREREEVLQLNNIKDNHDSIIENVSEIWSDKLEDDEWHEHHSLYNESRLNCIKWIKNSFITNLQKGFLHPNWFYLLQAYKLISTNNTKKLIVKLTKLQQEPKKLDSIGCYLKTSNTISWWMGILYDNNLKLVIKFYISYQKMKDHLEVMKNTMELDDKLNNIDKISQDKKDYIKENKKAVERKSISNHLNKKQWLTQKKKEIKWWKN